MPRLRRHDHSPRMEMLPLLDVVFLLLTFFIYSFTMMIRADTVAVALSPVGGGGSGAAADGPIRLLTIAADGSLRYGGEPLAPEALQPLLESLAADADAPTLYVSLASASSADRGPVVWDLLQRVQRADVKNLVFVGPPTPPEAPPPPEEVESNAP